mgnify:CR=1 FL=1
MPGIRILIYLHLVVSCHWMDLEILSLNFMCAFLSKFMIRLKGVALKRWFRKWDFENFSSNQIQSSVALKSDNFQNHEAALYIVARIAFHRGFCPHFSVYLHG